MATKARPCAVRSRKPRRSRWLKLTAVYTPCKGGRFAAEILEGDTIVSQGDTLDEARENLADALRLMLEEAPRQVGKRPSGHEPPPYTIMEQVYVLAPPG